MILLDTYAWVEFFIGSLKGEAVKGLLTTQACYTSVVSLAEIAEWCSRNKLDVEEHTFRVKQFSIILNIDGGIATLAGRMNHERKKKVKGWGMLDSFILATAATYNLKISTGDDHFRDLPNVSFL